MVCVILKLSFLKLILVTFGKQSVSIQRSVLFLLFVISNHSFLKLIKTALVASVSIQRGLRVSETVSIGMSTVESEKDCSQQDLRIRTSFHSIAIENWKRSWTQLAVLQVWLGKTHWQIWTLEISFWANLNCVLCTGPFWHNQNLNLSGLAHLFENYYLRNFLRSSKARGKSNGLLGAVCMSDFSNQKAQQETKCNCTAL